MNAIFAGSSFSRQNSSLFHLKIHAVVEFPSGGPDGSGIPPAALEISNGRPRDGSSCHSQLSVPACCPTCFATGPAVRQATQPHRRLGFPVVLAAGLGYIGIHVVRDLDNVTVTGIGPYLLLGLALTIALGFEFVNGFHDTANAVATVIYTNSMPPQIAVVWSGCAIWRECCCRRAPLPLRSSPFCRWS